jgi:hypothetical protein
VLGCPWIVLCETPDTPPWKAALPGGEVGRVLTLTPGHEVRESERAWPFVLNTLPLVLNSLPLVLRYRSMSTLPRHSYQNATNHDH